MGVKETTQGNKEGTKEGTRRSTIKNISGDHISNLVLALPLQTTFSPLHQIDTTQPQIS